MLSKSLSISASSLGRLTSGFKLHAHRLGQLIGERSVVMLFGCTLPITTLLLSFSAMPFGPLEVSPPIGRRSLASGRIFQVINEESSRAFFEELYAKSLLSRQCDVHPLPDQSRRVASEQPRNRALIDADGPERFDQRRHVRHAAEA